MHVAAPSLVQPGSLVPPRAALAAAALLADVVVGSTALVLEALVTALTLRASVAQTFGGRRRRRPQRGRPRGTSRGHVGNRLIAFSRFSSRVDDLE